MNKGELVNALAEKTQLSKKASDSAVTALFDILADTMAKGDKVQLIGFGTFEVKARAERTARNPRTGETVKVAASKVPAFKPGKALKDKVNA